MKLLGLSWFTDQPNQNLCQCYHLLVLEIVHCTGLPFIEKNSLHFLDDWMCDKLNRLAVTKQKVVRVYYSFDKGENHVWKSSAYSHYSQEVSPFEN